MRGQYRPWTGEHLELLRPFLHSPMPFADKDRIRRITGRGLSAIVARLAELRAEVGAQLPTSTNKSKRDRKKVASGEVQPTRKCANLDCRNIFTPKTPFITRCANCHDMHSGLNFGVDAVAHVTFR